MDKLLSDEGVIIAITEDEPILLGDDTIDYFHYNKAIKAYNLKYKPWEAFEWKDPKYKPEIGTEAYLKNTLRKYRYDGTYFCWSDGYFEGKVTGWQYAEPYEAAKSKQELICPLNVDGRVWEENRWGVFKCGNLRLSLTDDYWSLYDGLILICMYHSNHWTISQALSTIKGIRK